MQKEQIQKNIKDLEYSDVQHVEIIFLGFIGTTIISLLFTTKEMIPTKKATITGLIILGISTIIFLAKKREKIKQDIQSIKVSA